MKTLVTVLALALTGCRSGPETPPLLPRVDWGHSEIDWISRELTEEFLETPALSYIVNGASDDLRVLAYSAGLANRTDWKVRARAFVTSVERYLLQSGRFRIVTEPGRDGVNPDRGASASLTPEKARERALELGADLAVYGFVASRRSKEREGWRDFFVHLGCIDVASGESIWTGERPIVPNESNLFGSE